MSTVSAASNRHPPVMPLPMPTYAYRYPNSDSTPYSTLPDKCGIYNPCKNKLKEIFFSIKNRFNCLKM